jgi:hypothetical protein
MEKLGVVVDDEKSKTAGAGDDGAQTAEVGSSFVMT